LFRGSPSGNGFVIRSDDEVGEILEQAKRLARDGSPVLVNVQLAKTDFREGSLPV